LQTSLLLFLCVFCALCGKKNILKSTAENPKRENREFQKLFTEFAFLTKLA
jgi:hypothetical protein